MTKIYAELFSTTRGDKPVEDYLLALNDNERAQVFATISELESAGYLTLPYGRKMAGHKNLYEIRSGKHRILYTMLGSKAIMLHAFKKQSNKTPLKEIETALTRSKIVLIKKPEKKNDQFKK